MSTHDHSRDDADWVDFAEAARQLGVSHPTLYRWIRSRRIKAYKAGRRWRLHPSDIQGALDEHSVRTDRARDDLIRFTHVLQEDPMPFEPGEHPLSTVSTDDAAADVVRHLITAAVRERASDVHINPRVGGSTVLFRVDGSLTEIGTLSDGATHVSDALAELAGGADQLEAAGAGRMTVDVGERSVDVRVGQLPTISGPKLTLRILDPAQVTTDLDTVVPEPEDRDRLQPLIDLSHGLALVSGPTGSGKTTLAYAMLKQLCDRGLAVFSVEDPVEVRMDGLVQVQAGPSLSEAAALRRILVSDPDVIFLADASDRQAARLACKVAIAGHLTFVQVHAADTAEAIERFTRTVGDPDLVATALAGATCQRLVRRLCTHCRVQTADGWTAPGCDACSGGHRGRLAIYEVLDLQALPDGAALNQQVREGASAASLRRAMDGVATLEQRGQALAEAGRTSLDEVRRVR